MKQLGNQIIVSLFNEKLMFDTLSLGKLILLFLQLTYRSLADIYRQYSNLQTTK